ncbi:unnamed protein product [Paramecium primaurelia]|uniref:Transmembrane protein n=1 Tax=Paramecium primaurelia TaxID=5886 RepID=A0A8S1PDZ7_PARPR|nr:unnamed protein product [Paramecium primaurelia]
MAIFKFDILNLESITFLPNLSVSFDSSLTDNNNMAVDLSKQTILLQQPKVLSKDLYNVANKFQDLGSALIIGLGSISVLMLFFGDPLQSLEIFGTLHFKSYLKFVNVVYPQILQLYFNSCDIVTVNLNLITFKIKDVFNTHRQTLKILNQCQSIHKYLELDILNQFNCFLVYNLVILSKIIQQLLFYIQIQYFISSSKSRILEKLGIKFYKLNKKIINLRKLYTIEGFKQLFYVNSWDLLFKVLLFIISNTQQGYRSIISYCICFLVLFVSILLLCQHLKGLNKNFDFSILRNEQCIYQFKKLIFILIFIDIQESDIFQCTMITLLILVYIGFLFMIKQNIPKIELIGNAFVNQINCFYYKMTSSVYFSDFQHNLTNDLKILIGFGQIQLLILGLLGLLIKLGNKLYRDIQQYYQRKQQNHVIIFDVYNIQTFIKSNKSNDKSLLKHNIIIYFRINPILQTRIIYLNKQYNFYQIFIQKSCNQSFKLYKTYKINNHLYFQNSNFSSLILFLNQVIIKKSISKISLITYFDRDIPQFYSSFNIIIEFQSNNLLFIISFQYIIEFFKLISRYKAPKIGIIVIKQLETYIYIDRYRTVRQDLEALGQLRKSQQLLKISLPFWNLLKTTHFLEFQGQFGIYDQNKEELIRVISNSLSQSHKQPDKKSRQN